MKMASSIKTLLRWRNIGWLIKIMIFVLNACKCSVVGDICGNTPLLDSSPTPESIRFTADQTKLWKNLLLVLLCRFLPSSLTYLFIVPLEFSNNFFQPCILFCHSVKNSKMSSMKFESLKDDLDFLISQINRTSNRKSCQFYTYHDLAGKITNICLICIQ